MLVSRFAMTGMAYLLGSISNAVLISRCCGPPDPRDYGSHKPRRDECIAPGNRIAALIVFRWIC